MPTVGEQLRTAREAQGLSLSQVSETTKIMSKHLADLEASEFDRFAAPVYIRGFVRTYAGILRLDVARVMADLEGELAKTERFREPPSLTGPARGPLDFIMLQVSRLNWRIILPLVVLVVLVWGTRWVYRAWESHRSRDPLADLGPGLYTPPQPTGDILPLTNAPPKR